MQLLGQVGAFRQIAAVCASSPPAASSWNDLMSRSPRFILLQEEHTLLFRVLGVQ